MISKILARGGNGVAKGTIGLLVSATVVFLITASSPNKPRTLTPEWRNEEKKYMAQQNTSER